MENGLKWWQVIVGGLGVCALAWWGGSCYGTARVERQIAQALADTVFVPDTLEIQTLRASLRAQGAELRSAVYRGRIDREAALRASSQFLRLSDSLRSAGDRPVEVPVKEFSSRTDTTWRARGQDGEEYEVSGVLKMEAGYIYPPFDILQATATVESLRVPFTQREIERKVIVTETDWKLVAGVGVAAVAVGVLVGTSIERRHNEKSP